MPDLSHWEEDQHVQDEDDAILDRTLDRMERSQIDTLQREIRLLNDSVVVLRAEDTRLRRALTLRNDEVANLQARVDAYKRDRENLKKFLLVVAREGWTAEQVVSALGWSEDRD